MRPATAPSADELSPSEDETLDQLLRGRLRLLQPRRGARVTADPLLLADFAAAPKLGRILDLGCGVGVIALALGLGDPSARLAGVELQPQMAALARRNGALNGLHERFQVVAGDLAQARSLPLEAESFDLVVSNPPYSNPSSARTSPLPDRALSRHEVACTVEDVVRAARRFLRPRGRFAVIFPAERAPDLLATLVAERLRPRTMRPVHSVADEPARVVLVEAVREYRGGLTLRPPLVVHEADRRTYTSEAARILGS